MRSGAGGVEAHMSRKSQGSHENLKIKLFNERIYVDISQSVTACFLKSFVPNLKTRDVLSYLSLSLLTKSLFDLLLVLDIITSPIIV